MPVSPCASPHVRPVVRPRTRESRWSPRWSLFVGVPTVPQKLPMAVSRSAFGNAALVSFIPTCALALALVGCSGDAPPPPPAARPALVATVGMIERGGTGFAGVVRAKDRAVLSTTVAGRVTRVDVDLGDRVRPGQILLVLDPMPHEAGMQAAEASVVEAEASAREAAARLDRVSVAATSEAASATELGALKTEARSAAARLNAARAALAEARWRRRETVLRSPIDGVVSVRHVESGQALGDGMPAIEVDGAGREIVVDLPQDVVVAVGDTVDLSGPGGRSEGRIVRLNERVDAAGIRRAVVEAPASARVGEVWSVHPQSAAVALRVPLRAVQRETAEASPYVWRVDARTGRVAKVPVRVGAPSADTIAILAGLSPGDRVVIAGAVAIRDGERVVPVAALR